MNLWTHYTKLIFSIYEYISEISKYIENIPLLCIYKQIYIQKSIRLFKQNNISHINLCNYVFLQKTFIVDLISDYIVPDSFVIFLII